MPHAQIPCLFARPESTLQRQSNEKANSEAAQKLADFDPLLGILAFCPKQLERVLQDSATVPVDKATMKAVIGTALARITEYTKKAYLERTQQSEEKSEAEAQHGAR